jgi:hypothetical protein
MKQQHSITTLPPSPEAERRSRMIKYTVMMSIRVVCIICLPFAQGWWLAFFAVGAIVLPYIAVVIANVTTRRGAEVLRPGLIPIESAAATPRVSGDDEQPDIRPDDRAHDDRPDARSQGDAA